MVPDMVIIRVPSRDRAPIVWNFISLFYKLI